MAVQPTENALTARRILRTTALPAIEQRLKTRKAYIDTIAGVATEQALGVLAPSETASSGWALLRIGVGIVANAPKLVPEPTDGGPPRSFTGGVLLGAMVTAIAGDQLLDAASAEPDASLTDPRAAAATLGGELLDPIASPESRATFAGDLVTQMDADIPGIDHALAGSAVRVVGVWLARSAPQVAAPIANGGLIRRKQNAAPAGCGFAGALIAQIGLTLT